MTGKNDVSFFDGTLEALGTLLGPCSADASLPVGEGQLLNLNWVVVNVDVVGYNFECDFGQLHGVDFGGVEMNRN